MKLYKKLLAGLLIAVLSFHSIAQGIGGGIYGGSSLAIGSVVGGGAATRVLWLDTGSVLANSADFTNNDTTKRITVGQNNTVGGLTLGGFGSASAGAVYTNAVTPGATTFALAAGSTYTQINAPTAGGINYFSVNGTVVGQYNPYGLGLGAVNDVNISRVSAGVMQIGTSAANALGSLNLTNIVANGVLTLSNIPSSSGVRFLCISTTGVVTSQAAACVGT